MEAIERAGIEPALADPDRGATVLDHVADVTLVYWLLGSAQAEPEHLAAIHGPRLARVLERLVDTPIRGFVYEAPGAVGRAEFEQGAGLVREAKHRWRIPAAIVEHDPNDWRGWCEAMLAATRRLVGS
jgi:hypothetical protein